MADVARKDICQGAHGEGVVTGDAASQPGVGRKISEKRQSRQPDPLELLQMAGPQYFIRPSTPNANVLIITWQRFLKATCEPESAE